MEEGTHVDISQATSVVLEAQKSSEIELECCVQQDPGESDPKSNIPGDPEDASGVQNTLAPSDLMSLGQDHRDLDNALSHHVLVLRTLSAGDPLGD